MERILNPSEIQERLNVLASQAAECTACRLHEGRTRAVFADGSAEADLMLIGEGPGYYEDRQGLPFVGKAGLLLNRLLGQVGLERHQVYIANVVKCRPPNNRDPRPDEIEACKHFLVDQLRLIDPKVVMTMGNFATKLLLKTSVGITRTRGQVYPWWGRVVIPTFHPAAALRSGPDMEELIKSDLDLAVQTVREHRAIDPQPEPLQDAKTQPEEIAGQLGFFN